MSQTGKNNPYQINVGYIWANAAVARWYDDVVIDTTYIGPENTAPVANNDSYSATEDTTLDVAAPGVLGNDTDAESNPLTAVKETDPDYGTLTLNPDGSFVYAPAANYCGPDSFTYKANDGALDSNVATVSIDVACVNDAPVAVADSYNATEDTTLIVAAPGVLANDTDVDSATLTAVKVTDPGHGTVTLNADGSFVYTPTASYHGADSFSYKANDGIADSNVAVVNITVNSVIHTPSVTNATTNEDTQTTSGLVISRNPADGSEVTHFKITAILNGTLYQNDGTTVINNGAFITYAQGHAGLKFTPAPNFNGTASFVVQASTSASNAGLGGSPVTAIITVNPINDPPVAQDDTYTTNEDTPLTVPAPGVLGNDTDVDGDPLTAILVTSSTHGALMLSTNGAFTYTPNANYNGSDIFTYKARDGIADSNIATVTINVHSLNDAPVALDDSYTTHIDTALSVAAPGVLGNDSDADGDSLTAVHIGGPAHGALVLNGDGSFVYTPTTSYVGLDSFTYRAGDGVANSSVATVTLSIGVNNYPLYLPLVSRQLAPTSMPDLVVVSASVTQDRVQVIIKNQGNAPVPAGNGFWVDLYVNPSPVPTGVNQIWSDGRSPQGIVWGVTGPALPLDPGQSLTLAYGDIYYWPSYSNYAGSLPVGTPIYVQVDSSDVNTTFGGVLESHEASGGIYNNILGPVYSTATAGLATASTR